MSNPQQVYLIPFVTLLIMLGPFSVDTYLPAFPAMESVYSISTADMSQTLGAFLFAFALPTLAWGPLIDRFGRKSTVVISLLKRVLVFWCWTATPKTGVWRVPYRVLLIWVRMLWWPVC